MNVNTFLNYDFTFNLHFYCYIFLYRFVPEVDLKTYSLYGVSVLEVEIDCLTGEHRVSYHSLVIIVIHLIKISNHLPYEVCLPYAQRFATSSVSFHFRNNINRSGLWSKSAHLMLYCRLFAQLVWIKKTHFVQKLHKL